MFTFDKQILVNLLLMQYKNSKIAIIYLILTILFTINLVSQNSASPACWMYPEGDASATKYISHPSSDQNIFNFVLKWQTPHISGDVKPLIGNLVNNERIFAELPYAPNEIAAIIADEIVIIDGTGRLIAKQRMPQFVENIKSLSVLIDTLGLGGAKPPMIMGFETIEVEGDENGLIYSYLFGHDANLDSVKVIRRLAIDLSPYSPNDFGSIKPVYGKNYDNNTIVYATVDISNPTVDAGVPNGQPFFRGFTQFTINTNQASFPLPDIGDDVTSRSLVGPEIAFTQPSISEIGDRTVVALPSYPDTDLPGGFLVDDPNTNYSSSPQRPYFFGYDITDDFVISEFPPEDLSAFTAPRPRIKAYYLDLTDSETATNKFILVAEEYNGIDGSDGVSKLHLHEQDAFAITSYDTNDIVAPPYAGSENHFWSVAVGNVDGNADNSWLPYFPNNQGNELIVTQSTRDFAVPASKLSILRYFSGVPTEKPSPPDQFLFPFDTIATQRINGWIAAVNDLDGFADGKDEMILVDGSEFSILQLRDYEDEEFRVGIPLDTLFTFNFPNQTISNVAVADLEGDGRNDIIVTTYDSTYVFGTLIPNTLMVTAPVDIEEGFENYCAGDTVRLEWINLIHGQTLVNLRFVPVDGDDNPIIGQDSLIIKNIDNSADTVIFDYAVDSLVIGRRGFFVVEATEKSLILNDSTDILNFEGPQLIPDELEITEYRFGDMMNFEGEAFCGDSIAIEYRLDDSTWVRFAADSVQDGNTYDLMAELPCMDLFTCSESKLDTLIDFRLINFTGVYADTSDIFSLNLLPALFPVEIDSNMTADPTKIFRWKEIEDYPCDSVSISVSLDNGANFSQIAVVALEDTSYSWIIPVEIPDQVLMRFCCTDELVCVRTDTILNDVAAKYIDIVAPNPYNPLRSELEIIYRVPENTNVSIRIYDQANRIVSEPVKGIDRQVGFVYTDRWDGRRRDGSPVANGMYYISLEFSNGAKEIYPVFVRK